MKYIYYRYKYIRGAHKCCRFLCTYTSLWHLFLEPVVDRYTPFTNGRRQGPREPREWCLPTPYLPADTMAGLAEKSYPPGSYQPSQPFPPATKSASSGNYHPKLSREYISAGARLRVCGSLSISTRSRLLLHEGKYLPETDTTCGKQYALGGIQ